MSTKKRVLNKQKKKNQFNPFLVKSVIACITVKTESLGLGGNCFKKATYRPAYLYRFSRDIPILTLDHDFPISCGGVPILEDAGIFSTRRFRFGLFSPLLPNPPRILHLPPIKALRCRYK